ncbi:MAG: hypothetical protein EA001_01995 [Oscillatoriales cyanobacterium]|nr:MAG: hypothetical protein EA001_01995 [Oscillatoriales cyanobacterium]
MLNAVRSKGWPWLVAWVLPALLLAALMVRYGVNLPTYDQWDTPGVLFVKLAEQQPLTFADFISQHNESRKVFPRLIFLGLAYLTGWDIRAELAVIFVLVCGAAGAIFALGRSTVADRRFQAIAFALASCLLFSPSQWENWVYSIQIVVFLPIFCITTSLWLAQSSLKFWQKIAINILLATVSTYSSASGMFCWFLSFPALFLKDWIVGLGRGDDNGRGSVKSDDTGGRTAVRPYRVFGNLGRSIQSLGVTVRQSWIGLGVWLAAMAANLLLYFWDYYKPPSHPSFAGPLQQPIEGLKYWFGLMGAILGFDNLGLSQLLGGLGLLGFLGLVMLAWRGDRVRSFEWVIFGCYAIGTDAIVTLGRFGFGPDSALTSRYQTFSLYLWIAITHLSTILLPKIIQNRLSKSWRKGLLIFGLSLFLVLHYTSFVIGSRNLANFSRDRHQGKACLTFINSFQDERCFTEWIYPELNDHVLKTIQNVNQLGFIQPPLASPIPEQTDLATLAQNQPVAGTFQKFIVKKDKWDRWEYAVAGQLTLGNGCQPPRSVLLAYEKAGKMIPFTTAKVGRNYRNFGQILGDFVCPNSRWGKHFRIEKVIPDPQKQLEILQSPKITAWAFDSDRNRLYPLTGSYPFPPKS